MSAPGSVMNQLLIDTLVALGFVLFSGWCLMGPRPWLRPKRGCAHVLPAQIIGMGLGGAHFSKPPTPDPCLAGGRACCWQPRPLHRHVGQEVTAWPLSDSDSSSVTHIRCPRAVPRTHRGCVALGSCGVSEGSWGAVPGCCLQWDP